MDIFLWSPSTNISSSPSSTETKSSVKSLDHSSSIFSELMIIAPSEEETLSFGRPITLLTTSIFFSVFVKTTMSPRFGASFNFTESLDIYPLTNS